MFPGTRTLDPYARGVFTHAPLLDLTKLTRLCSHMPDEYSLYEAKARLSSLVRQVREGRSIVITVHGVPAAELRAIAPDARPQTLEQRLVDLDARGLVVPARRSPGEAGAFPIGTRKPGALRRFLSERE